MTQKPWTPPTEINNHLLPEGREWHTMHTKNWTPQMLPFPYRPMMHLEAIQRGDEFSHNGKFWETHPAGMLEASLGQLVGTANKNWVFHRTTRPIAPSQIPVIVNEGPLTKDQKRIKIAEACGWKHSPTEYNPNFWFNERLKNAGLCHSARNVAGLPDYFNDLNAMHEAEKSLTQEHQIQYAQRLSYHITSENEDEDGVLVTSDVDNVELYKSLTSTAAQRAEAFGRTLNLW